MQHNNELRDSLISLAAIALFLLLLWAVSDAQTVTASHAAIWRVCR